MARKIAVCSQKGGVGKTTNSINVAAGLAEAGYKVLVIDSDPQANATTCFGFRQQDIRISLYEVLVNSSVEAMSAIRRCNCSLDSLWLLPASASLVSAEIELVKEMGRELVLKEKMEDIEDQFDFILVDCSPGSGLLVLNALFFCDEVILPIQSQFLALEGMDRILHTIVTIQTRMRHPIGILGVLCSMYDRRTRLSPYILYQLYQLFGNGLLSTVININTKLAEAPLKGKCIFEYEPKGNAADNYRNLVREIVQRGQDNWKEDYAMPHQLSSLVENQTYFNTLNDNNQIFKHTIENLKPLVSKCMSVERPVVLQLETKEAPQSSPVPGETQKSAQPPRQTSHSLEEEDILWT